VPEADGGLGLDDPRFPAIVAEEAMRSGAHGYALVLLSLDDVPVRALRDSGRAACLSAVATSALDARLSAVPAGRGCVLDGTAHGIVNAVGADLLIVAGQAEAGSVVAVVGRDAPGLEVAPVAAPIGVRSAGLGVARFDGVMVSGEDVLASGPQGGRLLDDLRAGQRLLLALAAVAAATRALDVTVAYVLDRRAFGRPIARFDNTQQVLGAVIARIESARALAHAGLAARLGGSPTAVLAAAAKLEATAALDLAVDTGVQLHGGYGYIMEYAIAGAFADARFLRLYGGTDERLRQELAATAMATDPWRERRSPS
jgi:alkylation response protein AidB-like acyl-CoA dehydrogenase